MSLVCVCTSWKHQRTTIFSRSLERNKWHDLGWSDVLKEFIVYSLLEPCQFIDLESLVFLLKQPPNTQKRKASKNFRYWKCLTLSPHRFPVNSPKFPELIMFRIISCHCVEDVRNWSFSGRHLPAFGLNTKQCREILCISSYSVRIRENTDQGSSEYWHFLRSVELIINYKIPQWL